LGLYIVLFVFSIYTLAHRAPPGRLVLLVSASTMFLLGTFATAFAVAYTTFEFLVDNNADALSAAEDIRLAINSVVVDLLLLYRCYIIWGSNKKIIILPAILVPIPFVLLGSNGTEFLAFTQGRFLNVEFDPRVPYIVMMGTTLFLMLLTAGRIWYLRREAYIVGCGRFRKRYDFAIAIILESGAVYCVSLIIWVVSVSVMVNYSESPAAIIFEQVASALFRQTMNMAPTLLLVRVGLTHYRLKTDTMDV
ncbi:hypothetical protein GGX14DRAFT_442915, partial [Mycena pura]